MSQFAIFPYLGIVYSILDISWIWNDIYFLLGNYWCMWRYHGTQGWQRGSTLCFCTLFMRRPFIQSFTAMKIEKKIANEIDLLYLSIDYSFFINFFFREYHGFFPTSHHVTMFRRSTSNAAYSGLHLYFKLILAIYSLFYFLPIKPKFHQNSILEIVDLQNITLKV